MQILGPKVPKTRRIAWNALADAICALPRRSERPDIITAFADTKRKSIAGAKRRVVACAAVDVLIAAQDIIVKQKVTEFSLFPIERNEIVGPKWCRHLAGTDRA